MKRVNRESARVSDWVSVCVCVRVCMRVRARERERGDQCRSASGHKRVGQEVRTSVHCVYTGAIAIL
jgi:hypothetical protein